MNELPPSILSHVSIGTNQFDEAIAFYDRVLGALDIGRIMEHGDAAVAWGRAFPEFWVQKPIDGQPAGVANGVHVGFLAPSPDAVDAFHAAAVAAGGSDAGRPGPRPDYGPGYYGAFVRDLDGHKIEAMHWDDTKAA